MNTFKENFAKFLESPNRADLAKILKDNYGEMDYLDFKTTWIDFPKVAKHMLAMSNTGGGIVVFGVSDTDNKIDIVGIEKAQDKADVDNKLRKYLPSVLKYECLDIKYEESEYNKLKGKIFQIIIVPNQYEYCPFLAIKEGAGLKENTIYVRRGTKSIEANYEELQTMLNNRIKLEYGNSSEYELTDHFKQLKTLYSLIKKTVYFSPEEEQDAELRREEIESMGYYQCRNKLYPEIGYEEFLSKMIDLKMDIIERELSK